MWTRAHSLPRRAAAGLAVLTLAACGSSGGEDGDPATSTSSTETGDSTGSTTSPSSPASSPSSSTKRSSSSSEATAGAPGASACVSRVRDGMSSMQQAGQLVMAAMEPGPATALDPHITSQGLGSMFYLGGWQESSTVKAASDHLQQTAPTIGGTKVGMLVAADQEGGEVQQLTGNGFTTMPSGLDQAGMPDLRSSAKEWGSELKSAGVNVNLAPTADTVPESVGRANEPIGKWGRQYGATPGAAGKGALAFARGMQDAGVEPTIKHFPGIGRITGNTDFTDVGITDEEMTTTDEHLDPFARGIDAGTNIVMVGTARYAQIDGDTPAIFSKKIVDDMLRQDLGFEGVVITDDVGAAKSVAATSVGERATKFVAAGGDIVLTATPSQVPTMVSALEQKAKEDAAFDKQLTASVTRVLTLKEDMGLLRCG